MNASLVGIEVWIDQKNKDEEIVLVNCASKVEHYSKMLKCFKT